MFTAKQYRAKAAEYRGLLADQRSPAETSEFRNLEQAYATLADNEEWLALNASKIVPASDYDIAPTPEDRSGQAYRSRQGRRAYSALPGRMGRLSEGLAIPGVRSRLPASRRARGLAILQSGWMSCRNTDSKQSTKHLWNINFAQP